MSVTGFRIDGSIQKYDYNALDNKPDNGLTEATKSALLQLARKVAYIDEHGEDYYQELYDSFYGNFVNVAHLLTNCYSSNTSATAKIGAAYTAIISPDPGCTLTGATVSITMGGTDVTGFYSNGAINIPNVTGDLVITVTAMSAVSSISAVYTQSGTVYDNDTLDSLKADLVVTAHYSDSSTQTVPAADYTLSGTLAVGTSTITVFYGGKTTTFNVTVEKTPIIPIYEWDLTQSLTDKIAGLVATTTATQNSTGLVFDTANTYADFGAVYQSGRTYELDVLSVTTPGTHNVRRIFMADVDADTAYGGGSGVIFGRTGTLWGMYSGSAWITIVDNLMEGIGFFNGKTMRIFVDADMIWHIYAKTTGSEDPFVLVGTSPSAMASYQNGHVYIGGNRGDGIAPATFTGLRVYEGEID